VGLTTSIFSRPYMRVELEHGRLTPGRLRLYHSMYQLFMTMMLVALTTNNLGLLWVALEAATLSTVLLVTLYRTPASLEAGWKYFILCGVGIAQALFGTILLYFAAEKVLGAEGVSALLWTHLAAVKGELEPTVLGLAFAFLLVGYVGFILLAELAFHIHVHSWQKFIGVVLITAVTMLYARGGLVRTIFAPVVAVAQPPMRAFAWTLDNVFWPLRKMHEAGTRFFARPKPAPEDPDR
jgi:hypothetical protein